jgi:SPP1 family predicted phage head-tail adaptor
MITIGDLFSKIEIQSNTPTRGADGSEVDKWSTTITTRAKIETTGGREFFSAQRINSETQALFTVRYRVATITPDMRIKVGSKLYQILFVNNINNRNRVIQIAGKEVV